MKKIPHCQLYLLLPIHHWEFVFQLSQDWKGSHKKYFPWKTKTNANNSVSRFICLSLTLKVLLQILQTKSNRCWWRLIIYSTVKVFICSLWLCKNKYYFPPLNDPNIFGTLDYDANIFTKIDNSNNHEFKSMSTQELNKLHLICELEWTQLLTFSGMSVQNPQLVVYLLQETVVAFSV